MASMDDSEINKTLAVMDEVAPLMRDIMTSGSIYIVGTLLNMICIVVLLRPKLKEPTYTFMLANSFVELAYCLISAFTMLVYCGSVCGQVLETFAANFYNIYFMEYFTSCLAIYSILIEIYISIKRYLLILNRKAFERVPNILVIALLGSISLIYYLPILFVYKVDVKIVENKQNQSETVYSTNLSDFGRTALGTYVPTILSSIRIVLVLVVLLIVNVMSTIAFREHLKRKASISSRQLRQDVSTTFRSGVVTNESSAVENQRKKYSIIQIVLNLMVILLSTN